MPNNTSDLVSYDIVLGQLPSGEITPGGSNVPTGLTISGQGTAITIKAGQVRADELDYILQEDLHKNLTTLFEPGDTEGALLYGDELIDGTWYVYATSNGASTDVLVSQSDTPLWPHESDPTLPNTYSAAAYRFYTGYRIGTFVVEGGIIKSTFPDKDLADAYVSHDLATVKEVTDRFEADEADIANLQTGLSNLTSQVEADESVLEDHESRLDVLEPAVTALQETAVDHETRIGKAENNISDLTDRIEKDESDIEANANNIADLQNNLLDLVERVGEDESDILDNAEQIGQVRTDVEALTTRVEDNESDIEGIKSDIVDLNQDVSGLTTEVLDLSYKVNLGNLVYYEEVDNA